MNNSVAQGNKMPNNFGMKYTGNNLPIYIDELEQHIYKILNNYDKAAIKPKHNPYIHPIIHTTKKGQIIQVPSDLHLKTIQKWNSIRYKQQKEISKNKTNYFNYALIIAALILMYYVGNF